MAQQTCSYRHQLSEDLFSLGIVLYELISGHPPFKADSEAATLNAITGGTPELLARFRREVPPQLQSIIDKSLEKNAATRYQHAAELSANLRRLSASRIQAGVDRREPWNRYVVTAATAVLLIIAHMPIY